MPDWSHLFAAEPRLGAVTTLRERFGPHWRRRFNACRFQGFGATAEVKTPTPAPVAAPQAARVPLFPATAGSTGVGMWLAVAGVVAAVAYVALK